MTQQKCYPLADRVPLWQLKASGIEPSQLFNRSSIKAVATGEKRAPKKDEWYLSGAIIEAYMAPADHLCEYQIAKLVLTREVITTEIVKEFPDMTNAIMARRESDRLEKELHAIWKENALTVRQRACLSTSNSNVNHPTSQATSSEACGSPAPNSSSPSWPPHSTPPQAGASDSPENRS